MKPTATASTATEDLPPELVAKFAAALERLRPDGARIGLAVSGGTDSMAMLLLAHVAIPGEFEVATVDHGLRPEAGKECALVECACAERGIACSVLRANIGPGNLQHEAREARYGALAKWAVERGLRYVATAHHADDQAETLIMRLNRGSGLAGLAGVRETSWIEDFEEFKLIRPVLTFRRAELAGAVAAAGIEAAHDPSNADESFERVRIRKALAEADWLDPPAWAQSASHLAEAEETLNYLAHQEWRDHATDAEGGIRLKYHGWRAVDLRLLDRAIRELGGTPRGGDVARLLDRLEAGKGGNIAGVLVTPERGPGTSWLLRPEPPRRTG